MIASLLSRHLPTPMAMLGVADSFGQSGSKEQLFAHYGLTTDNIKKQVITLLQRRG